MPRSRPLTVTAGAGLALVAGILGAVTALLFLSGGAPQAFLMLPFDVWFLLIVTVVIGLGGVLAATAIGTLRGNGVARAILIAGYGLIGFIGLSAAAAWPKLVGVVSLVGLVLLVTPRANAWFRAGA